MLGAERRTRAGTVSDRVGAEGRSAGWGCDISSPRPGLESELWNGSGQGLLPIPNSSGGGGREGDRE